MYDIAETHAEAFRFLSTTTTLEGFVTALRQQVSVYAEMLTTSSPVPAVVQPSPGAFIVYADEGWEGTFQVVLRAALTDAFQDPELLTLVVWARNERVGATGYVKHVGQAGDDVLHENLDKIEGIRFYDGTFIDLDDVVAVQF